MNRHWRWAAGLTLALPVLIVLALYVERWRGRHELAATLADLRAQGRYQPPEVLFAPPGMSNGHLRMLKASHALNRPDAPASMRVITPGRAVEAGRQTQWKALKGPPATWEALEAWYRDSHGALEALRDAFALPECRSGVDWRRGFSVRFTGLTECKKAAQGFVAAALVSARNGDPGAALAWMHDLQAVERSMERDPLLISQLVRTACASLALPVAWDLSQRPDWSDADLLALQRALPSTNFVRGYVASLWGEAALWGASVSDPRYFEALSLQWFAGSDPELTIPSGLDEASEFASDLFARTRNALQSKVWHPIWCFAWLDQAQAHHLRSTDELAREWQAAGDQHSLQSHSAGDVHGAQRLGPYDTLRFWLTSISLGALESGLARALRLETERALIETGIAIQRFTRRHGRAPQDLDELVPEWLGALPLDGMDGQPLRYRRDSEGTWRLWSVGEDFKDDGGDPTPLNPGAPTFHWWRARDAVLPVRAGDAEVAEWQAKEEEKLKQGKSSYRMDPLLARRYGLIPQSATNNPSTNTAPPADERASRAPK
ncbi:MAG: hypothetical protein J0L84_03815 [Verrucomicrobia bacterium]|nr:hypothetical protein [Verrucomicrobiota bacterium]